MTTNSWLPPLATPATDLIWEMGPCRVPWNGVFTVLLAAEMLKVVPLGLTVRKTADPWNPAGHPVLVDQVGVLFIDPLAGLSATPPGSVPKPACAPWAPRAAHTPSSTPPTAMTPTDNPAIERTFLLLNLGSLRPFRQSGSYPFIP